MYVQYPNCQHYVTKADQKQTIGEDEDQNNKFYKIQLEN